MTTGKPRQDLGRRGTTLVLAVLLIQVAVPLVALMMSPPTRFGFQMFGGYEVGNVVTVRDTSGELIPFDEGDLWHVPLRPELDWSRYLPDYACARLSESEGVVIFQHGSGERIVPCP